MSELTAKSIEEMAHDYVVACLQSGSRQDDINIAVALNMAKELKEKAKIVMREMQEDERRRRW